MPATVQQGDGVRYVKSRWERDVNRSGGMEFTKLPETLSKLRSFDIRSKDQAKLNRDPACGFYSFGRFLELAKKAHGGWDALNDGEVARLVAAKAATGMSADGDMGSGGLPIPPAFARRFWERVGDEGQLWRRTRQLYDPAGGDSIEVVRVDETSRADGSRQGGVRGYWLSEAEQVTHGKLGTAKTVLHPTALCVLVYVTDKLRKNSELLAEVLTAAAAREVAFKLDEAIVAGTGAGQPLGVIQSPARVTVPKESGQAATTLVQKNVGKMFRRFWGPARRQAVWLMNTDVYQDALTATTGSGSLAKLVQWFPAGGVGEPMPHIYGRPVLECEACPTLGTEGDIVMANLNEYIVGGPSATIEQTWSMHLRFDYGESIARFMIRLDGQPWYGNPITPLAGSETKSSFVTVADRS